MSALPANSQIENTIKKENTLHISKLFLLLAFMVFSSELIDAWESLLDFSKKLAPISVVEAVAEYSATVNSQNSCVSRSPPDATRKSKSPRAAGKPPPSSANIPCLTAVSKYGVISSTSSCGKSGRRPISSRNLAGKVGSALISRADRISSSRRICISPARSFKKSDLANKRLSDPSTSPRSKILNFSGCFASTSLVYDISKNVESNFPLIKATPPTS